jgi:hypothetical protein
MGTTLDPVGPPLPLVGPDSWLWKPLSILRTHFPHLQERGWNSFVEPGGYCSEECVLRVFMYGWVEKRVYEVPRSVMYVCTQRHPSHPSSALTYKRAE